MIIPATWVPPSDVDPVLTIAQDLFTTMIDGEPGHLVPWPVADPVFADPRYAWVEVAGPVVTRIMLTTGRQTGEHLTRALLAMEETEPVSDADFADAVGELANVVGGNVKSLVTNPGALSLPVVTTTRPDMGSATNLMNTCFGWKGDPLGLGLWALT